MRNSIGARLAEVFTNIGLSLNPVSDVKSFKFEKYRVENKKDPNWDSLKWENQGVVLKEIGEDFKK